MNDIQSLLENIYNSLLKTKSPLIRLLKNGIGGEYINSLLKDSIELPESVYSLYEWRNGTVVSDQYVMGNITLFTMGIFSPFERAYKSYRELAGKDRYWTKDLFPVFESGGAGFHLVECNPINENCGVVYFYDISAVEFDTIIGKYDSIKSLLESVSACYEQGIYTYSQEGLFKVLDYERSFEISKNLNPRCREYWNLLV